MGAVFGLTARLVFGLIDFFMIQNDVAYVAFR